MNASQTKIKLGMNILGIECTPENYQLICNACYLAEKRGVYLFSPPTQVLWDKEKKQAFSPLSHEHQGNPSWSLLDDIHEIYNLLEAAKQPGFEKLDPTRKAYLDEVSTKKLEQLKLDLKNKTIEELVGA